jgi:hypothetical protein
MSTKHCPICDAIIEFAQCNYRICDKCGWQGDWTKLINREPAIEYILEEIRKRHNTVNFDINNTPNDWVSYICAYAGRAAEKVDCNIRENCDFRENMIKVAVLVVAAIETQDR